MGSMLFHGYNCFSSVIGQHFINVGANELLKAVNTHWSFDFNSYMFEDKLWCVGTCVEPSDYLLQYDLLKLCGVKIKKNKADRNKANAALIDDLNKYGSHIVMLDFFYLDFWNKLERFTNNPTQYAQHNPHFVNVIKKDEEYVYYQDPSYGYCGKMKNEHFFEIRNRSVRKLDINFEYYTVEVPKNIVEKQTTELLYWRFDRYLEQKQYEKISAFADAVYMRSKNENGEGDKEWIIDAYYSLQSVIYQHLNLLKIARQENIHVQFELRNLLQKWTMIRKEIYKLYFCNSIEIIEEIKQLLCHVAEVEEKFSRKIIVEVGN